MKTTINVTGVENKGKKMNILDNRTKYNFWITKQDGTNTKAMEGFQKLRPIVGDILVAEVESVPSSFQNAKGETVNYTDNKILFFYTDPEQHQNAQVHQANQVPTVPQSNMSSSGIPTIQIEDAISNAVSREEFNSLANRVRELEIKNGDEIKIEDVPW